MADSEVYTMAELTLFPTDDPDSTNFTFGTPGVELLPRLDMLAAAQHCLSQQNSETYLQYGPSLGCKRFRTQLATFLTSEYGPGEAPVSADSLAVTNGASGSFSNIITLFTHPTKTRFIIENPTYFLAIRVLEDHGISRESTIKIPVDQDGLRVDVLEETLQSEEEPVLPPSVCGEKRFKYLLFLVPSFSNPTGISLSLERRKRLVELARKHDILVVCDDVYHLLHLGTSTADADADPLQGTSCRPPPRVVSFDLLDDSFGNVISNQSFSKILGPGLRLGWVEAGRGIINQFLKSGLLYSGGSPSHFTSGIVGSAISTGVLKKHLLLLRDTFRTRMLFMCTLLEQLMLSGVRWRRPEGGYFIWIELPQGHDTGDIARAIRETGTYRGRPVSRPKIGFAPGNFFSSDATHGHCLRLTYAHYDLDRLRQGLEALATVLKECLE